MKKAIFLDRDGVIVKEQGYILSKSDLKIFRFSAEAVKLINNTEYLTIVITNQACIAKGLISYKEVEEINQLMIDELAAQGARIDGLYFSPFFDGDTTGFQPNEYLKFSDWRKPGSGMLKQAALDFNIDLSQSWIIGDSERDIICGKNVGCKTIGVETGKGLEAAQVRADQESENLLVAVNYILKNYFPAK